MDFDQTLSPEPSSLVGFAQNHLIRDAENRDEQSLPNALADPNARLYLYAGGRVITRTGDNAACHFSKREAEIFKPKYENAILLGITEDGPRIAVGVGIDVETLESPFQAVDFRTMLYSSSLISDVDASAIGHGGSISYWNRMNRFCGKCGHASETKIGGYRRDCPNCDSKIFPSTDPVVIMLAVKDDKCLLGRSPHFQPGWYSTLAGFVEPGETIEAAVRRETFEESGIKVGQVHYFASQPWPFPHSLMIGVHAEALSDEIHMDESELEDCRWFSREEVHLMRTDKHPDGLKCPPSKAIASSIIGKWAEG